MNTTKHTADELLEQARQAEQRVRVTRKTYDSTQNRLVVATIVREQRDCSRLNRKSVIWHVALEGTSNRFGPRVQTALGFDTLREARAFVAWCLAYEHDTPPAAIVVYRRRSLTQRNDYTKFLISHYNTFSDVVLEPYTKHQRGQDSDHSH